MSDFADIAGAYQRYQDAGNWADVNYGLIYTCNAGWLDLGHLNPNSSRRLIGAANLWAAVRSEGPRVLKEACRLENADLNIGYTALRGYLADCHREPYIRFPDNQYGYLVRYRQDHGGYPGRPGVERHYVVKMGLTEGQKKSVALSIFMDVSRRFEWFQRIMGLNGVITDSGHSQEDFVSNLVGFYIAVGELTKAEAIRIAHPVSQRTSEAVWQANGPVGSNKNYTFRPHLLETYRNDPALRQCVDECALQPRRFPAEFQTIQPVEAGNFFIHAGGGSSVTL